MGRSATLAALATFLGADFARAFLSPSAVLGVSLSPPRALHVSHRRGASKKRPHGARYQALRPRLSAGAAAVASGSVSPTEAPALPKASDVVAEASRALAPVFTAVDRRTKNNLRRVLTAFRRHGVGPQNFAGVDGYGHGDIGRDTLDKIYAEILQADAAMVRVQCMSGTHAISCALFGVLRPGQTMLACSGAPYDTLDEVIGSRTPATDNFSDEPLPPGLVGSLREWGVAYGEVPLKPDGAFDLSAVDAAIAADPTVRLLHVQRSCGYQWRRSIPIAEIQRFCEHIKATWAERDFVIFVDNCYGELVEDCEPCGVGADLVAGSLIKNPGGTIAKSGGYVAGKLPYVRAAANRLSAPGVAGGATLGQNRDLYQGLFMAPFMVGESLKGAYLLAEVFGRRFGLETNPPPLPLKELVTPTAPATVAGTPSPERTVNSGGGGGDCTSWRTDIVQAVRLGSRDRLVRFCEVVQRNSPINSFCRPVPGVSPGYGDEVIFADGTFVEGSTLELSADGPLREPFVAYLQGCTHWTHWALILEEALPEMGLASAAAQTTATSE